MHFLAKRKKLIVINDRLQGLETPTIVGGSDIVGTPTPFVCLGVDIFLGESERQPENTRYLAEVRMFDDIKKEPFLHKTKGNKNNENNRLY